MEGQAVIRILGTRGSAPVSGEGFRRYGWATTCVLATLAGQTVVLDAGSGLLSLKEFPGETLPLLLSHAHADHLLGLPLCPALRDRSKGLAIYAAARRGLDAQAQVSALLSPPLWPVGPDGLRAAVTFHGFTPGEPFRLGPITVDTMDGIHPGEVTLFRLTGGGKRVVFATDCTLTEGLTARLTEFARDCDLLLCDGQYSSWDSPNRIAFGHSAWGAAARLGADCGAKEVRVIHHDPFHTDDVLDAAAAELLDIHPRCAFAREGEDILL